MHIEATIQYIENEQNNKPVDTGGFKSSNLPQPIIVLSKDVCTIKRPTVSDE